MRKIAAMSLIGLCVAACGSSHSSKTAMCPRTISTGAQLESCLSSASSKGARAELCWQKQLTTWIISQTPGGYADPLHDISRAEYTKQVIPDANGYFQGNTSDINDLELGEFHHLDAVCGKPPHQYAAVLPPQ